MFLDHFSRKFSKVLRKTFSEITNRNLLGSAINSSFSSHLLFRDFLTNVFFSDFSRESTRAYFLSSIRYSLRNFSTKNPSRIMSFSMDIFSRTSLQICLRITSGIYFLNFSNKFVSDFFKFFFILFHVIMLTRALSELLS